MIFNFQYAAFTKEALFAFLKSILFIYLRSTTIFTIHNSMMQRLAL